MGKRETEEKSINEAINDLVSLYGENTRQPQPEKEVPEVEPEEKRLPEEEKQEQKPGKKNSELYSDTKPEAKSKRIMLLLKPSIHEKLKETVKELKAEYPERKEEFSVNDLINRILEQYFN